MAEQRQPFRFRLPWLPAPEPTPAPPQPSQATQAPPQRPPFRPAGVAPAQPPPARAESQPPSQLRATSQPKPIQSPQGSPTRSAPKPKVASATSPPKPSEATSKAQPEATSESPTAKQKPLIQKPAPKGPTELAARAPVPEPEVNQTTSGGRSRVTRVMDQHEPEEKKVIDTHSSPLTSKPKGHPVVMQDEQVHKAALHREMKEGLQRLPHKLSPQGDKHPAQEKPLSIITLTGENTGATMHMRSESGKREQPIHIHRGYQMSQDENLDTTTDGERSSRGRNSEDPKLEEEITSKLYVNNNAQGVNNSLVYNSSVTERNPGVHVVVSRDQELIEPSKETETIQAQKAEVGSTISEKLAYAPTVRRRCLRGLLLESSDSDPENLDKPRRHGCRVGCGQKGKDAEIDLL